MSDAAGERRVVSGPPAAWARAAARALAAAIARAVSVRGSCALAVAGGDTPRPVHELLARDVQVPWGAVDVYFGDERCVPPDDPQSNHRAAHDVLGGVVAPARWHRMHGEDPDPDAAARAYERVLPRHLDVLVLGVGEDGHCASLFPRAAAVSEGRRRVVAVEGPKPPRQRLTITPPAIEDARLVVVLARGAGKADAVAAALEGEAPPEEVPARLARRGTWILDEAAAGRLGG